MKILSLLCLAVLLVGCSSTNTLPVKEQACQGSYVRGSSPVVYFETASSKLSADAKKNLNWAVAKMKRWDGKNVNIKGYTDPTGTSGFNKNLSKKRAYAVRNYLVQQGISSKRINVEYFGESDLVCQNPACYDVNRRAVVDIFNPKHWWIF